MSIPESLIPQNIAAGISRLDQPSGWHSAPRLSADYRFIRIASLCYEGESSQTADDMRQATAVWLRGLSGLDAPWAFALQGTPDGLSVFWGIEENHESVAVEFRNRFAAAFPGSELDETANQSGAEFSGHLSEFSHVACLSETRCLITV